MKKIMFDDACSLTQAVKEGRKTNTRRQEKALDKEVQKYEETYKVPFSIVSQYYDFGKERLVIRTPKEVIYVKPRYKVGEVVAVAQSYKDVRHGGYPVDSRYDAFREADWGVCVNGALKVTAGENNKMFVRAELMPNQIRFTNVRVERLQDISDEDCLKEGILNCKDDPDFSHLQKDIFYHEGSCDGYLTPREAFAALINKISGKGIWKSNPFVYVYEFELLK